MGYVSVYIFPETLDYIIGSNGRRIMDLAIDYNVKISLLEQSDSPFFKIETNEKQNFENCHKVRIIIQKLEEYCISKGLSTSLM